MQKATLNLSPRNRWAMLMQTLDSPTMWTALGIVPRRLLLLLVPVFSQALLTLVGSHFMALSLFTARHTLLVF